MALRNLVEILRSLTQMTNWSDSRIVINGKPITHISINFKDKQVSLNSD